MFHVLSAPRYQVEHHLFPDMPARATGNRAKGARVCMRYGLPVPNSGPFHQQLGSVQRTILRLAFRAGRSGRSPAPTTAAGAR